MKITVRCHQPHAIMKESSSNGTIFLVMGNSGWQSEGFYDFVSESIRDGIEPDTWWIRADRIAKAKELHLSFAHLLLHENRVDCLSMGSIKLFDHTNGLEVQGHFDERYKGAITRALGVGIGDPKATRFEHSKDLVIQFEPWSTSEVTIGTVCQFPET